MTLIATRPRVFLTGGDHVQWALDTDLRLTRQALAEVIEPADLADCEIVHSMWWEGLCELPPAQLAGKRVICQVAGEPFRDLTLPGYQAVAEHVGLWITQSTQAREQLESLGYRTELVPYAVDPELFRPLIATSRRAELRRRCGLPADAYVLGNFHRDTLGHDLRSPKLVKGPDVLLEIARELRRRGLDIHVLLAGPRRHWLRRQLTELGIAHTFLGHAEVVGDDIGVNTLTPQAVNRLYSLLDLCVVSSRSEGGPRSILEAAAARCKVISTPVGLARDVLDDACIYDRPAAAADIIAADLATDHLAGTLDGQQARIRARHQPHHAAARYAEIYGSAEMLRPVLATRLPHLGRAVARRAAPAPATTGATRLRAGIWHQFFAPPYGGGNQFVLALCKAMQRRGDVELIENDVVPDVGAYLLNSIHFDLERFAELRRRGNVRVVHRIDGPIHLIRGRDRELDEFCFELNADLADSTVLQSAWTYQRIVAMGYRPVRPVIIHNAVDPEIFHRRGRAPFDPERKIRLISTSWSNNERKGGPIYRWIDQNLDWSRFEYTFVGRCSEPLENIRVIPPVPSEPLADILRQHDIYITASRNDPCSNALIEGLACGLPALYFDDGGHPELVGQGGLPFRELDQIFPQLETLVAHYGAFQNLIAVPDLEDVAQRYVDLLLDVRSQDVRSQGNFLSTSRTMCAATGASVASMPSRSSGC